MPYLLGIDIGTSGVKTLLIDESGDVISDYTRDYPLHTPRPLWAEQDPEDWWNELLGTLKILLCMAEVNADEIVGVGLTGQMHGSVFLDSEGNVLRPALLWCDQRTAAQCEWITQQVGESTVIEETLNPVLTGFTAGKIIWLRDNEPDLWSRVAHVLLPKDFIRYRLTGTLASEVSDASGTALFNVRKRTWSDVMLDGAGIPRAWMPPVSESPEVTAYVSEDAARLTGLRPGTPVVGGAGDQAAGAVGNGVVEPGIVSVSIGTSGVVFACTDQPVMDPALRTHTFCHAVPGKWHVMGVMLSAGGSLRWWRDTFAQAEVELAEELKTDPYEVICSRAYRAPLGCEGLMFLPYLSGERTPHKDPNARGVFYGVTYRSDRDHFARAVMEGVCYGLNDSYRIMAEMGLSLHESRATGGGARSAYWRQMLANITGIRQYEVNCDEGPALGACLLAGVGVGIWPDVETACRQIIKVLEVTPVEEDEHAQYQRSYAQFQRLYTALKDEFFQTSQEPTYP